MILHHLGRIYYVPTWNEVGLLLLLAQLTALTLKKAA